MRGKRIVAVDLFCGAGGESTGLRNAARALGLDLELLAVNHWDLAISTHSMNHPEARHLCESIQSIDPLEAIPSGRVNLLWASPECTHHSIARGGRPRSDQSRASAWLILKWLSELYVERVIIENVKEFADWGPLGADGKPLKSKKGESFRAFLSSLKALGYRVDYRILCAADYGDPTTRRRLFIQAVRGNRPISWPEVSHTESPDLFGSSPWKPAREIIDWSIPGSSLFDRKKPLAPATMARIEAGINRYWGDWAEPFLVHLRGTREAQIKGSALKVDRPLPTITAGGGHIGLVQPFLTKFHGGSPNRNQGLDRPVGTVDCSNRFGIVEPFILHQNRPGRSRRIAEPLPTVTTRCGHALVEPFILATGHRSSIRTRPIGEPLSTVVTKAEHCLVEPFLLQYYGNGEARRIGLPLDTVTCKDRFALIDGCPVSLDIRFRMLQPHELAAAQGFPGDYQFSGNKSQQVKQIGNAVPVNTAAALCKAVLGGAA